MDDKEADALAVRLLKNLQAVLNSDLSISEYDFLPTVAVPINKNPIVVESDKLGLEQWSLKYIYTYVHRFFCDLLSGLSRFGDDKPDFQGVFITQVLLMLNPENMTAWNYRKKLIESRNLSPKDDLKLMDLILAKFPKSPETFAHRKWVVNYLMDSHKGLHSGDYCKTEDSRVVKKIIDQELDICTKTASKYSNNYNAWSHRIWLFRLYVVDTRFLDHYITKELATISTFVSEHISDYSGLHYKQFLLKTTLDHRMGGNGENQFQAEFQENLDLISRYPDHEALWCHRRALLLIYMKNSTSEERFTTDRVVKKCKMEISEKCDSDRVITLKQREDLLHKETAIFRDFKGCKQNWEKTLNRRYLDWLQKITSLCK